VVLLIKFATPWLMTIYINQQLQKNPDYTGNVHSVSLNLLRPSISLHNLHIVSRTPDDQSILDIPTLKVTPKILHLLRGQIHMEIYALAPSLTFVVRTPTKAKPQTPPVYIWHVARAQLLPLPISDIFIDDGSIQYIDKTAEPIFLIKAMHIHAEIRDLQKPASKTNPLPANLKLYANTLGDANAQAQIAFNPKASLPTFELKFSLKHLQLKQINNFLEAYTDLRATAGEFNLFVEATGAKGHMHGYAKPFFKKVQLTLSEEDKKSLIKHLYKSVAQWLSDILKNNDTGHTATKIEFSGSINDPNASLWNTIINLLRNAFLEALLPRFD
jgi:uncharacterized protein involved in outer membrane biogenesis